MPKRWDCIEAGYCLCDVFRREIRILTSPPTRSIRKWRIITTYREPECQKIMLKSREMTRI